MNEWNIQSRAHQCETCAKPFEDKQPYHTLLLDDKQEFRRLDVCEYCWQTQFSDGAREHSGFISHWQGVYASPSPPEEEAIQKENAETLLRKIIELNDPKHAPTAYILAVMLERKRILKVKEQIRREDGRVFIYEQPKTGDMFTILDPELHLDQLEEVQRDVARLLEHGLDKPVQEEAPEGQSAADAAGNIDEADAVGSGHTADEAAEEEILREDKTNQMA